MKKAIVVSAQILAACLSGLTVGNIVAQAHPRTVHHAQPHVAHVTEAQALAYVKHHFADLSDKGLHIVVDHVDRDQFGRADYVVHVFDWNQPKDEPGYTSTVGWYDVGDNGVVIDEMSRQIFARIH